jgi:drug/metabolite transporter (DMT)-like permease
MKYRNGVLAALAAAACFGSIPAIVKYAYANGVGIFELLAVRYMLASIFLVPAALLRGRKTLPSMRRSLSIMVVAGVFLSLEAILYFYSITLLPSSVASLVLFTFPLIVSAISHFFGRKISWAGWVAMLVCLSGLAVVMASEFRSLSLSGISCAFLAAVSYSCYLLFIDRLVKDVNPMTMNAIVSLSNAVTMTAAAFAAGSLHLVFTSQAWIAIVILVIVSNLAGFQYFFVAMKKLGPARTSILNMAEPLFTVIIGVVVLQEQLSLPQILGAFVMITGLSVFLLFREKTLHQKETECED